MAEATLERAPTTEMPGALSPDEYPDISHIVTEDDTPVDNFHSEKQQRLLTESLYTSWTGPGQGRSFVVSSNVGLFASITQPPLVPDVFLSLDVQIAQDWWAKRKRTYFFWEFGKPPEVVIEVVSNEVGNETTTKIHGYARMGIAYYAIFDPQQQVQDKLLHVYALDPGPRLYREIDPSLLEGVGLGLTVWEGVYEGREDVWIRWLDPQGKIILTGAERTAQERQRAEQEHQRAERLAAKLRALGIDPDDNNGAPT